MGQKQMIVYYGPSGCGKSTMLAYAKSLGFTEPLSHTSRSPRKGEKDGVNYHFSPSEEAFLGTEMVEYARYNSKDGSHLYGKSKMEMDRALQAADVLVMVLEINGINNLKKLYPGQITTVFVTIPLEEMEARMRARGDSEADIQIRLQQAVESKEHELGSLADHIIVNWDLEESKTQVKSILEGFQTSVVVA